MQTLWPKGTHFTVENTKLKQLQVQNNMYESDGVNKIVHIPVKNVSDKNLTIKRRMKLFNLQIVNNYEPSNAPQLLTKIEEGTERSQKLTANDSNSVKQFIQKKKEGSNNSLFDTIKKDKYISKNEFEIETKMFKEKNYMQPSITQYIKDKSSVTEIELVDEKPINQSEFLQLFDIAHLSKQAQNQAESIFLSNRNAFSLHKYDIGCTDLFEMPIRLNSNLPKMQKYIPIPHNMREKTKEILDQMLKHNIIRECPESSQYCSNILVIKKKDKNSIRLLFDGRLLNYDTIREPMAMISKPEILAHLVNKTHLTSLDFSDAFFHIPLAKEAQPLTAFYSHTHGLRMCFTRCPQGLKNSPLYLKLLLDKIFKDMTDTVLFYADDLLIATNGSIKNHLKVVEKVLQRITKANLKLRPQKLLVAKEHIEFLGMIFKRGTISIPDLKLEAFKRMESPTTPKKAKSLICCLSYYRHFCPKFAELSHDINQATLLHNKQFKWTPELESKLRILIDTICKNATLCLPNPAKTFYVQTDASKYCGAGRIFQKDDNGEEKVIAAVSRTFTKTERGYAIFKQEILALLYTLKSMDFFLRYAKKLILLVDAKSIIYLRLAKESSGILLRFSLELSRYNAEIYHIPGEENVISDVLSRQHTQIEQIKLEDISNATLSEKDTIKLINRLTIPEKFTLSQKELSLLLDGNSPPTLKKETNKKSKAVTGKRNIKNVPTTLGEKKPNLPKTTRFRPGMNSIPFNMITRSMAKQTEKDSKRLETTETETIILPIEIEQTQNKKVSFANPPVTLSIEPTTTPVTIEERKSKRGRPRKTIINNKDSTEIETVEQTNINVTENNPIEATNIDNAIININVDNNDNIENDANVENGTNLENELIEYINKDNDNTISYTDVSNISHLISQGSMTIKQFRKAQNEDKFCNKIISEPTPTTEKQFLVKDGLLFKKSKNNLKLVLPKSLVNAIIFTKHFSVYGAHNSMTRILRDIKKFYFIPINFFKDKLSEVTKTCYLCQIFNTSCKPTTIKQLPIVNAPRLSWSIDMITDCPTTEKGNTQILLAVDDYTSFVVCIPVKNATAECIIEGLQNHIFAQFGVPKVIRSDQQASFYNSTVFCSFLTELNIQLTATSVASPFSNGRAESQIKNIKFLMRKILFQENQTDSWDKHIYLITSAHNKSCGIYGYSAEEIMFAHRTPQHIDILSFNTPNLTKEDYISHIFKEAERIRKKSTESKNKKNKENNTYKNQNKNIKRFELGTLVLHKQLQASTGKSSKYKPLFTGPYSIVKLNTDKTTALLEHLHNGSIIKAHFTNMQKLYFNPKTNKLKDNFDKEFLDGISEKYTLKNYKKD